jgi:hypothetical protein
MPDLLSHAFLAYTIGCLLSRRYDWISPAYLTVLMAGAFIPDLSKIHFLVPNSAVGQALGMPFSWFALHTTGGVLVACLVGVVVVAASERRRVFALLSVGAASHLVADGFLIHPSGRAYEMFWPLTQYRPPLPGLYLSTQPGLTLTFGAVALAAYLLTRRREQ